MSTLVFSPHLDDAVFSAWTVLRGAGDVRVVNVFNGVPPPGPAPHWDRITGSRDRAEAMRARVAEDREALALAGCEAVGLGLLELQYREQADGTEAVTAVAEAAAGASMLYAPAGIGGHTDHLLVRDAALTLGARTRTPVWLYADVPYATQLGWPHWVTGGDPDPHLLPEVRWQRWLESVPCGVDALRPHPVALDDQEAELKLRAMRAYRSQFTACNGGPFDRLANPQVLRFEVLWEVDGS